jgi:hypothetical protein
MRRPLSKRVFPNKKEATIVDDSILFHGAQVRVDVHNSYTSDLLGRELTIAAERSVTLREDGVECSVSGYRIDLDLDPGRRRKGRKPRKPPYSAFAYELRKKDLKRFPVLFRYDDRGRFLGVTIFPPRGDGGQPSGDPT